VQRAHSSISVRNGCLKSGSKGMTQKARNMNAEYSVDWWHYAHIWAFCTQLVHFYLSLLLRFIEKTITY
jgi:hypothetical protein